MTKITAVNNGESGLSARTKINIAIQDVVGEDFSTISVTELSDVTNAGSGQIITSGERTDLGTALQPGDNVSALTNDAGYTDLTGDKTFTDNVTIDGQARGGNQTVSFTATPAFDFDNGNVQQITLTSDITSWTISNELAAGSYLIYFIQDGVGGHDIPDPTGIDNETDNSIADFITSAGDINIVAIYVMPDGTSIWTLAETITA